MSKYNAKRLVRERMIEALRRELMGPNDANETFSTEEFPTNRYIVGRLAPAQNEEDGSQSTKINHFEDDSLNVGLEEDEGTSQEDVSPPLTMAFLPSSMGLSFLVEQKNLHLDVELEWGDYRRIQLEDNSTVWKRFPKHGFVRNLSIQQEGKITPIALSEGRMKNHTEISGLNDPEIYIEGVVRNFSGYRAVSLFLINRRTAANEGNSRNSRDESWIFQPKMKVTASNGSAAFVAKDFVRHNESKQEPEILLNDLLYRNAREFATGHGVAANWEEPKDNNTKTSMLMTEFIPKYEIPTVIAPSEQTGGAVLDMKILAESKSGEEVYKLLEPMLIAYDVWIKKIEQESISDLDICQNAQFKLASDDNIEKCNECSRRMWAGLKLIKSEPEVFEAFKFANLAMWDQRIHSLYSSERRKGAVNKSLPRYDIPQNRSWRPFQIGFILLNLYGMFDETSEDRNLVDLLWFPTGGGKTEAYLGLAAFIIGLRRLRGDRFGMHGGAGVSIIMRYTLRLLTVQQFQRTCALIMACEVIRQNNPSIWGKEPFRIGLWVGGTATPNSFETSRKTLVEVLKEKRPKKSSPVQLLFCPRCGEELTNDKGIPKNDKIYVARLETRRTYIGCPNNTCEFSFDNSNNEGLPVVVVDDEIYRTCPTIIIATVDKFAQLPFKGEAQAIFGIRNRYSPTFGHLTPAHDTEKVGTRKIRDAKSVNRLLPPELIIQDELHLISGPLGTMVGIYETAIDYLSSIQTENNSVIKSKVIASTATIRRAEKQVEQLYDRRLRIFPPSGIDSGDSFFALEKQIDPEDDDSSGRMYVGVNAPGASAKTLLVRVNAILLASGQKELDIDTISGDPYGTVVSYFNSLRALGGAKRLVEDDVNIRLKYLNKARKFPLRRAKEIEELTSRLGSWKIPPILKKLDVQFPRVNKARPLDVLLATNMISVGVDIDRLGLMTVNGQPKSTAEYIQATSRVGRKHPGLVVTMYNWVGVRDLSHYERFRSYHSALYRYVEAISVTPFSSRAIDRGLKGIFATMGRLSVPLLSQEKDAKNFTKVQHEIQKITFEILVRAKRLVGDDNSVFVRDELQALSEEWTNLSEELLRYSWLSRYKKRPPDNSQVLLRFAGTDLEGEWTVPSSLREVEQTASFYIAEDDEFE